MTRPDGTIPLSVIIPTYNRAGYVRDCIQALRESGIPDLDIIVADDGSTDDTREVTAATGPHVRYLWQPNSGTPATARNMGFAVSRGRYVGFLDCDDAWLPGAPPRAVQLLDRYPEVDVLFADARMGNPQEGYVSWIESAGQETFRHLPSREPERGFRVLERGPFFRRMVERNAVFIGACILRREAFEQVGQFDPSLRGAADWELWLRMASRFTFGFMAEPLALYTRHLDNMSSDLDGMSREFCLSLENVLRKCDLLPAERAWVRRCWVGHLFGYAYKAYDRADLPEARKRFGRLLSVRPELRGLLFFGASCLPRGLLAGLRRLKRAVLGGA